MDENGSIIGELEGLMMIKTVIVYSFYIINAYYNL